MLSDGGSVAIAPPKIEQTEIQVGLESSEFAWRYDIEYDDNAKGADGKEILLPPYTQAEEQFIECGEELLDETFGPGPAAMISEQGRTRYDEPMHRFHGDLKTLIVGATPAQLAAYLMDVEHSPHVTRLSTWHERSEHKRFGEVRSTSRADNHFCVYSTMERTARDC